MLIVCWAAKGGSGTTVVSSALALLAARHGPTLLVDLAGDAPAALGMAEPSSPGLHDWVLTPTAGLPAIEGLSIASSDNLRLLPRGQTVAPTNHERWADVATLLANSSLVIVVDAGTGVPPAALFAAAHQRLLVTQPCYLALRRHAMSGLTPTGIVLQHQPGRALRTNDVVHAVQAPVIAEVSFDPTIARAVDAGLLATRLPRQLASALRDVLALVATP